MFFGLIINPAMIQMMMNDIFQELIDEGVMVIYMDNILIFGSQTKEQHHTIIVWALDISTSIGCTWKPRNAHSDNPQ